MAIELGREHAWLRRFVGEWTYDSEAMPEPGKPPERASGRESVRSLGGVWVVCEGQGDMPDGGHGTTIMSLGYDPAKRRIIGTFIGSMMPDLWIYEGTLDPQGNVLTLNTEGPSFAGDGTTTKYQDRIEFRSDDHRVMSSSYIDAAGTWNSFMTVHYRRAT